MFDHGPVQKEEFRTPSELVKKKGASLMLRLGILAMAVGITPPGESRAKVALKPLIVDEKRFGKAPIWMTRPLLAWNQGKLSRKKRKAAKAKQSAVTTSQYNEYLAQHYN